MPNPLALAVPAIVGMGGNILTPITSLISMGANYTLPTQIAGLGEIVHGYLQKTLNKDQLITGCQAHGLSLGSGVEHVQYAMFQNDITKLNMNIFNYGIGVNDAVVLNQVYYPSVSEAIELERRKLITPALSEYIINATTGRNPSLTTAFRELRYEIPGPSDLIRFAVRESFDPQVVSQWGYAKEFPSQILPFMEKQGYGKDIGLLRPANATDQSGRPLPGSATWSDLYWWSHWELVSPTQAYEMLHRLYADSRYGPSPFFNGNNGFDSQGLSQLLKASDYPEYWRSRLEAISYHQLNRSDVMPMYRDNLIDRQTLYHGLRADGYRDEEATILMRFAEHQKEKSLGVDPGKGTIKWIGHAYQSGYLSVPETRERLSQVGLAALAALNLIRQWDVEMEVTAKDEVIASLKSGYVRGNIDETDLENGLNTAQIDPAIITTYLRNWRLLKLVRYKPATTRQLIAGYKDGVINRREAINRLKNLQYDDSSISLMVNMADNYINKQETRAVQEAAKRAALAAKQIAKEQLKVAKEVNRELSRRAKNLEGANSKRVHKIIKASTDKNILEWYKLGLIRLWEVYYRLYHKDFLIRDAALWVATKLPETTPMEKENASLQAQQVYRREPNPPLV